MDIWRLRRLYQVAFADSTYKQNPKPLARLGGPSLASLIGKEKPWPLLIQRCKNYATH